MGGNTSGSNILMIILGIAALVLLLILIYLFKTDNKQKKPKSILINSKTSKKEARLIKKAEKKANKKATEITKDITSIDPNQIADEALGNILGKVKADFEKEVDNRLEKKLNDLDSSLNASLKNTQTQITALLTSYYESAKVSLENSAKLVDQQTLQADQAIKQIAEKRKAEILAKVDSSIISILTSYLNETLVGAIDLTDQEEYIFDRLNANKDAIVEDIKNASI